MRPIAVEIKMGALMKELQIRRRKGWFIFPDMYQWRIVNEHEVVLASSGGKRYKDLYKVKTIGRSRLRALNAT